MSQVTPTDELSNSVSKLVELNKQITEAREDIKVLTQAEKSLKLQVKKLMTDNGLDVINLKKGKISVRKSSRKTGLNKTSVKEGLVSFYEGNEQQAELVLKVILDNLPVKESTSLALTGIKEKKQEYWYGVNTSTKPHMAMKPIIAITNRKSISMNLYI